MIYCSSELSTSVHSTSVQVYKCTSVQVCKCTSVQVHKFTMNKHTDWLATPTDCPFPGCSGLKKGPTHYAFTLTRHWTSKHPIEDETLGLAQVFAENNLDSFQKKRVCLVPSCSLKFRVKGNYKSHLLNEHKMGQSAVELEITRDDENVKKAPSHFDTEVSCNLCSCVYTAKWSLQSHLARIHRLKVYRALEVANSLALGETVELRPEDYYNENAVKFIEATATPDLDDVTCETTQNDDIPNDDNDDNDNNDNDNDDNIYVIPKNDNVANNDRTPASTSLQHNTTLEKKKMVQAPQGTKTFCPLKCGAQFEKAGNVRRHLKNIHNKTDNEIKSFLIKQTKKQCPHCGKAVAILCRHLKAGCKARSSKTTEEESTSSFSDVPREFELGGKKIQAMLKIYLDGLGEGIAKITKSQYLNCFRTMSNIWEKTIPGFKTDSLEYACHFKLILPDLDQVFVSCVKPSAKLRCMKTYGHFSRMIASHIRRKYCTLEEFAEVRDRFLFLARDIREEVGGYYRPVNKVAVSKTQERNADREDDNRDWMFHPEKVMKITKFILSHPLMKEAIGDLNRMEKKKLTMKYSEVEIRHILSILLLTTGNGVRPHVIGRMQVKEFQKGVVVDGVFSVGVTKHKNKLTGRALCGFFMDGLKNAVERYISVYKSHLLPDDYVFCTGPRGETQLRDSVKYMKKYVTNTYEDQDQKYLTPKSWRHAWSEAGDIDPQLKHLSAKIMKHSIAVKEKWYQRAQRKGLAEVGRRILPQFMDDGIDDNDTDDNDTDDSDDNDTD